MHSQSVHHRMAFYNTLGDLTATNEDAVALSQESNNMLSCFSTFTKKHSVCLHRYRYRTTFFSVYVLHIYDDKHEHKETLYDRLISVKNVCLDFSIFLLEYFPVQ